MSVCVSLSRCVCVLASVCMSLLLHMDITQIWWDRIYVILYMLTTKLSIGHIDITQMRPELQHKDSELQQKICQIQLGVSLHNSQIHIAGHVTHTDICVCICIYVYIYVHTYIYVYIYVYMYTFIYVYLYTCVNTCMYVHIYTYVPDIYKASFQIKCAKHC